MNPSQRAPRHDDSKGDARTAGVDVSRARGTRHRARPDLALLPLVAASWLLRSGDPAGLRWRLGLLLGVLGIGLAVRGVRQVVRDRSLWWPGGLCVVMVALVLARLTDSLVGR